MSYITQQHNNYFSSWRKSLASLELSDKQLESIDNCLSIQGEHGNWDYDEYMRGMFNGIEVIDSIIDSREPNFKESPKASLKLDCIKHDRFQRGSGAYKCLQCGKLTRNTGHDEAEVRLCRKCYNKAVLENQYADGLISKEQYEEELKKLSSNLKLSWEELTEEEELKINILHAIYCAEAVLPIFENKYPNDNRPRLAIEVAKIALKYPTAENKAKASAAGASWVARAASWDASWVAFAASATAYATADAASVTATWATTAIKYAKGAAKEANIDIDFDSLLSKAQSDIWEYINISEANNTSKTSLKLAWEGSWLVGDSEEFLETGICPQCGSELNVSLQQGGYSNVYWCPNCDFSIEPIVNLHEASLKLAWEEDPPNNPNRTSIENIKDFIGPAGIFVTDYNSLIELLNKYSINAYPTMLDALKHYENNPEFKGYLVKYPPYTIDERIYLEISMIKRSQGSEVYTTTSSLRIY